MSEKPATSRLQDPYCSRCGKPAQGVVVTAVETLAVQAGGAYRLTGQLQRAEPLVTPTTSSFTLVCFGCGRQWETHVLDD